MPEEDVMADFRHRVDLFVARSVMSPNVKQRAVEACGAIMSGLARGRDVAEPVRDRLNAPLIGPPRFGTAREYRTWKETRRARPRTWTALQWPLGIWLVIGVAVVFWVKSLLS
jgi:hypothetical protein